MVAQMAPGERAPYWNWIPTSMVETHLPPE